MGTSEPVDVVTQLAQALQAPSVGLEDNNRSLSGPQIWGEVSALAGWLVARGVKPGVRVGIQMERGVDAVVAIYAVLAAGGSFVPLDPAQPAQRLERLRARAGCLLVLTGRPADVGEPRADLLPAIDLASEAYLLFTSGSTGEPKGVPITHQGLADYLEFARSYLGVESPVAPLFTPLSFDLTITSLFVPILAGGRLIAVTANGLQGLQEVAQRTEINWVKATPSHLEILLRLVGSDHGLKSLVVGGEAFTARLARQLWQAFNGVEIFNEYGPTEAVVGCMFYRADEAALVGLADVPIGVPAAGVSLLVVDTHRQRVPLGAVGELLIASRGLTKGYLASSDGSDPGEDKFALVQGQRYYRTGDLVRLADPESLVYQGRLDSQIKVGGIRLEPTEVEAELEAHPAIRRAAARVWSPSQGEAVQHCARCGLPSNVPGSAFDEAGICSVCHDYERIAPQAQSYFGSEPDLSRMLAQAQSEKPGEYDCIHLLSGGKDSTYALYQLVELGFKVFALTLDNGFISEGAKDNVRASIKDLGIDHEFMTSDVMNEIFADSLKRHSNVCHGCYKTIYTLATAKADQIGAPIIFTGLSRGQLFETRLIPAQFSESRFDPVAIDDAVVQARRVYHALDDGPNRLLDTSVFADGSVFDRVSYVDFYRYTDVSLAEMLEFLDTRAPWVRPSDTGRSTNCLINAAGIHTHITEQGYHNYAEPYAWDVRLGHKTRDEAIDELDDRSDLAEVEAMLAEVGYEPKPHEVFTAWIELEPAMPEPSPGALRAFLSERLPKHAIPAAFVSMDELPTSANGKLAESLLPRPDRIHRASTVVSLEASTETERQVIAVWERVLGTEPIGLDDDFFALGGDSLAALEMVVALGDALQLELAEEVVFSHTSPRGLAAAIEAIANQSKSDESSGDLEAVEVPLINPWEQGFIFEHMNDPDSARQNVGRRYVVDGSVDVGRLVGAIHATVQRHIPLRKTASEERLLLSATDAADITAGFSPVSEEAFTELSADLIARPIDLESGPLLRFVIHPLVGGATGVAMVAHHAVTDAAGFDRIWLDMDAVYSGGVLASLDAEYTEHARNNARHVAAADSRWIDSEPVAIARLNLPSRASEPDGYLQIAASFSAESLRTVPGASPMATALAGLAASLSPVTQGDALTIGLPISTKGSSAGDLAGCWLNVVPAHISAPGGLTNSELLGTASNAVGTSLSRRMVPQSVVNARRRSLGLEPISPEVVFAFSEFAPSSLGAMEARHEVMTNSMVRAGLAFFAEIRGNQVSLGLEYDGDLITSAYASQVLVGFDAATTAMIVEPQAPAMKAFVSLGELIVAQAADMAQVPAVLCGDQAVNYQALAARADDLAHQLRDAGVGVGDKVGIYGRRSTDTAVAIVGVLRSGAAYVPLDPDYPQDRLNYVANDAKLAAVVVAEDETQGAVSLGRPVFKVSHETAELHDERQPLPTPGPEDLAYVIYTSGSTGEPKGVAVTQANIVSSTQARSAVYGNDPSAFLMVSSFAFDSSMVGIFWTLTTGGSLVLPTDGHQSDVLHLAELVERQDVTHILGVPALYRVLLDEAPTASLQSLEVVIVAGEPCPSDLVGSHYSKLPNTKLHNEYGPTETTVWSHHYEFPTDFADSDVPIGSAIPGVEWTAVDAEGLTVEPGQTGELIIGGSGVTAGYVGRPGQTAAVFVDSSVVGELGFSGRVYRTGDLVRVRPDGLLSFVGRVDRQIKVRGFRVEPEQIEAELMALDGVTDAAVGLEGSRLVAWVASLNPHDPEESARIRSQLTPRLPEHEVPSVINVLSDLPRTVNGKVDHDHLQAREPLRLHEASAAAASEHESDPVVAGIWAEVLGVAGVGPHDNFFDLGGDSILNMRIVARMRQAGFEVKPRDVFAHPTIAGLVSAMSAQDSAAESSPAVSAASPMRGEVSMLEMQRWFFNQKFTKPNYWNQSMWLEVAADVDLDVLEAAAQALPAHHDVLRSVFRPSATGWTQHVSPESVAIGFTRFSAAETSTSEVAAQIENTLDIQAGKLAHVGFLVADGMATKVFLTVHHLVIDGVSWAPLLDDWTTAFNQLRNGLPVDLGARSNSQQDWALALESAAHRSPWPDIKPVSGERPPNTQTLTSEIAIDFAAADDVETTVVAALSQIWAGRTGLDRVELMMESHGRDNELAPQVDLTRTVGWFTSQYPVVVELSDVQDLVSCQRDVRAALDAIDFSGLGYDSGRHHDELPGLAFNYLGQLDRAIPAGDLFSPISALRAGVDPANHRPHDLGVVAWQAGGQLHLSVDAASGVMTQTELDALAESLRSLILGPAITTTGGVDAETLGSLGSILDELDF